MMQNFVISVLGDKGFAHPLTSGTGKSNFLTQYVSETFMKEDYDPTSEDHYRKEIQLKGKSLHLILGDDKGLKCFKFNTQKLPIHSLMAL
jgi:hypothetical protein